IQWDECGEFVQLALKAVMSEAGTDAAMLNAGLFLRPLLAGTVTRNDLHETLPHPMRIAKITMTGEHLVLFLEEVKRKQAILKKKEVTGIGFRGKVLGKRCFSGVTYEETGKKWKWHQRPIQPNETYTFATVDHFIFANHFPILKEKGES